MLLFICCAGAYLAGSVNFSIVLFRALKKTDPRQAFSGNPGAFNVYRVHGFFWALAVLVLDVGRAMGVGLLAVALLPPAQVPVAGFGLILGNCFPCFHRYKGGKGVANFLGFYAILIPVYALSGLAVWLASYFISRVAFIGSILLVWLTAGGALVVYEFDPVATAGVTATALLISICHRKNINEFVEKKRRAG